jgi:hypothetical protein
MNLPQDIEHLSYDELMELNRAVVARIKQIQTLKTQHQLQQFRVGHQAHFMGNEGEIVEGTIVRINKKTVSLVTEKGARWNVSPHLLRKISTARPASPDQAVIDLLD